MSKFVVIYLNLTASIFFILKNKTYLFYILELVLKIF